MNRAEFYQTLNSLPKCYSWTRNGKSLTAVKSRGISKGIVFNPVTAVAHRLGLGTFTNNKKSTLKAGTALGLPREFTSHIYDATQGLTNRGNTQVVRGRLLSQIGLR